jgi:surface carbohydrate biosynthesis protein
LLLGVHALSRNFDVIIGNKNEVIKLGKLFADEGDVFIDKGKFLGESHEYLISLREKGVLLISLDEESGLNFVDYPSYESRYQLSDGIDFFDFWLTWGPRDFYHLLGKGISSEKLLRIGTPRSASWSQSELERNQGRSRSVKKDYVVIATNFTWESSPSYSQLQSYFGSAPQQLKSSVYADYELAISNREEEKAFQLVTKVCSYLLEQSNLKLVIRPHPMEIPNGPSETLRQLDRKRISVNRSIEFSEILRKSHALLHLGTSLAFESQAAGVLPIYMGNLAANSSIGADNSMNISYSPNNYQDLVRGFMNPSDELRCIAQSNHLRECLWPKPINLRFYDALLDKIILKQNPQKSYAHLRSNKLNIKDYSGILKSVWPINLMLKTQTIEKVKRPNISATYLNNLLQNSAVTSNLNVMFNITKIGRNVFSMTGTSNV